MSIYLELLCGMGVFSPEIIAQVEACQEKVVQLYKRKDILPYIQLQNQKTEFFVAMYFQTPQHIPHYQAEIVKEEQKASETI